MENVNYKNLSETLIKQMLSDYRESVKDISMEFRANKARHNKEMLINRFAIICKYDSFPIQDITKLAEEWNQNFSFLGHPIDTDTLEKEIRQELNSGEW